MPAAALAITRAPTAFDPVNDTLATPGCTVIGAPTAAMGIGVIAEIGARAAGIGGGPEVMVEGICGIPSRDWGIDGMAGTVRAIGGAPYAGGCRGTEGIDGIDGICP